MSHFSNLRIFQELGNLGTSLFPSISRATGAWVLPVTRLIRSLVHVSLGIIYFWLMTLGIFSY